MVLRHTLPIAARWRDLPEWLRYLAVVPLVALAFVAQIALPGARATYPFLTLFPVVLLAALLFGQGSGLFAALLASAVLLARDAAPVDLIGLGSFLVISLLTAGLIEALHRSTRDLAAANDGLEQALREADRRGVLLEEAEHRSRNDLQVLYGLLRRQARIADAKGEAPAVAALESAAERAGALARMGTILAPSGATLANGGGAADVAELLRNLGDALRAAIVPRNVVLAVAADPLRLPASRARALGLLVHELVANAAKYAFPNGRPGSIRVSFTRRGEEFVLEVEDDGVGLDPTAPPRGTGLGRRLADSMASQLGGGMQLDPGGCGRGTRWELRFPAG